MAAVRDPECSRNVMSGWSGDQEWSVYMPLESRLGSGGLMFAGDS